nr:hypothetical protein [uncultured Sphingomonas sp.]
MDTQALQTQQLQLLAQKALLNDQLKNIDTALGQIAAILQFAEANTPKSEPEAAPE